MFAETARMLASMSWQDAGFNKGADQAIRKTDQLDKKMYNLGRGIGTTINRLGKVGLAVGATLATATTLAVRSGLQDLATLEDAEQQVKGALKRSGLQTQITAAQISAAANQIESDVQAAFDDKDIVANTASLIRYGKVTKDNLKPAMATMTNLAAKTGDMGSAATTLGRALADPTTAQARLARSSIFLTDAQQKQINAAVKAGKVGKAQALVIEAVDKVTGNAAKNMHGPYRDALNVLNDTWEDVRKTLAIGFMPVIQRFSKFMSDELAKPATMESIRNFGETLAGGFEAVIDFAKRVPWGAVIDGLKGAATFAGQLFQAFGSIPPEAQAFVIALAGLNKLSGGMVGTIVSELGKGLIKGVLGITAGVVNVKGAVVNGGGGMPGGGPAGGGGKGLMGKLGFLGGVVISGAVLVEALSWVQDHVVMPDLQGAAGANIDRTKGLIANGSTSDLRNALSNLQRVPDALNPLQKVLYDLNANGVKSHNEGLIQAIKDAIRDREARERDLPDRKRERREERSIQAFREGERDTSRAIDKTTAGVNKVDAKQAAALVAYRSGERTSQVGLSNTTSAARTAGMVGASATAAGSSRVVGAIERKDMSPHVTTNVTVNVTPGSIQRSTTTETSYGRSNGSSGGGRNGGSHHERQPDG